MITLNVDLAERSYPIYIGQDLLDQPELLRQHIVGNSAVIVSNTTVAPLYLHRLKPALDGLKTTEVILPDGEEYKTLEQLNRIFDTLLEGHFDRNTTLIALGGGVVGDMTGFAAATYQRGVPFIQIPTTLLAQVDSSVGGKTGVNHPLGKNMIGAFYQPKCVIADTATLNTLEDRQLSAGLGEVIKYGLIRDLNFFHWLENNMQALLAREPAALAYAIERSCLDKAEIVSADERESGQRALLNLGHTFGHAIETHSGYGNWLHGEAVSAGICMAARFSKQLDGLTEQDENRIHTLLHAAKLPLLPPNEMSSEHFLELMKVDKKVKDGALSLILMQSLGHSVVSQDYSHDALHTLLKSYH
ncbi:MAG: 3-dehydroquinate synthase [Gammaproteobacteria bacterium]|nr:3-dehydroquinate synthase [Gammaproteobacteria bacterium]